MNDETGAKVIIRSTKESPVEAERVLVITGTPEARLVALKRIVCVVAPDEINIRHNRNMDYAGRRDERGRDDRDHRDSRNGELFLIAFV